MQATLSTRPVGRDGKTGNCISTNITKAGKVYPSVREEVARWDVALPSIMDSADLIRNVTNGWIGRVLLEGREVDSVVIKI
jgi:hypothetical protein